MIKESRSVKQMQTDLLALAKETRRDIVKMVATAKSGHPGGSLSLVELLSVLYFEEMNIDPTNPRDPNRDRFVLSKGHATPVYYAILSARGYFPKAELMTFRQINSRLQGHPDMNKTPGVDFTSGSLGQGLSIAVGMALAARMDQRSSRIYAVMGDGEQQEGQIWEAAMAAAHYQLANLTAILDNNDLQITGKVADVMGVSPLKEKWQAFGWNVVEIDGHNFDDIRQGFAAARRETEKPTLILAHTVKGKGISFMENKASWHGTAPNAEQLALALAELAE
ncbi:MAG: transketolase [Negativicutes bacterium]|nr:transketolase [Negativicutes bacterium]